MTFFPFARDLDEDELEILESVVEKVKPYMTKKGIKAIEKKGPWVKDSDGDYTTTLVSDGAECAFVFFDEKKIAKCAIEQAYNDHRLGGATGPQQHPMAVEPQGFGGRDF